MNDSEKDALFLSDSFIPTITKATVDGVMVVDQDYRILWVNDAALQKTGLSRKRPWAATATRYPTTPWAPVTVRIPPVP